MKHKYIDYWDLERVRMKIFRDYPTVNTKRCIMDEDILNFFLGLNIKEMFKYEPNQRKLGYDIWYE